MEGGERESLIRNLVSFWEKEGNDGKKSQSVVIGGGVLLVLEVATLLGKSDEIGEDHPTNADVIERVDRTGLDVLSVVVVETPLDGVPEVVHREIGLQLRRHFLHLQSFDLFVRVPHRHFH